ncbi:MAG: DUF3488 and DUF4129 domain-containing transglutaminase family protein [Chromatiaceae bacterium]
MLRHSTAPIAEPPDRTQVVAATLLVGAAYLPLARYLDWRVSAFVALLFALRSAALRWPGARPGRFALVALTLVGGANCINAYHSLAGQQAGTALLATMLALKLLEVRGRRDLRLIAVLVGFLPAVQFLFDQSMLLAAYLGLVVLAALALLVDINGGMGPRSAGRLIGVTLRLAAQAIPLTLVMFLLFPRLNAPLWNLGLDADIGVTGMSDRLELGSISELVINGELAFRARFNRPPPGADQLYWRGPVLWQANARGWSPGIDPAVRGPTGLLEANDPIDYEVVLEPSRQRWLFALDLPLGSPEGAWLSGDFQLLANAPLNKARRYRVRSALDYRTAVPSEYARQSALGLPSNVSGRMRELVAGWRSTAADDWELVQSALRFFNQQDFHYTLLPPKLGANPTDEFLFETRQGFCEHYASSFAVLMRIAGIPSRVVLGYLGGERNAIGGYHMIWQSDAHAWTEVLIPDRGWVRVDPTASVNPARVDNRGASRVLAGAAPLRFEIDSDGNLARSLRQLRFLADSLEAAWQDWVLDFSADDQFSLLSYLGLGRYREAGLALLMVGSISLVLGLILLGLMRQRDELTPLESSYRVFCGRLAAVGLARRPDEGPYDYGRRLCRERPDLAQPVGRFLALYIRERYTPDQRADGVRRLQCLLRDFRPRRRRA